MSPPPAFVPAEWRALGSAPPVHTLGSLLQRGAVAPFQTGGGFLPPLGGGGEVAEDGVPAPLVLNPGGDPFP